MPKASRPTRCGVYRTDAPHGFVGIQVIDSYGDEFALFRIKRRAFAPEFILLFRQLLETHDRLATEQELAALLRVAFPLLEGHRGLRKR